MILEKIISGGQSGVDRAALDAAIESHIPHGGWCPKGRIAEKNEVIPQKYHLIETESSEYIERTRINVEKSDGTLIFVDEMPLVANSGTDSTKKIAEAISKPVLVIELSAQHNFNIIVEWINQNNIKILNVAGPRESTNPGIYNRVLRFLKALFVFQQDKKFL